jgi:hypothetical protein
VRQKVPSYGTFVSGLHHRSPKWTKDWINHELGVLCDGLFGHGVNNPVAHFLDVNTAEDAIGQPGESLRDIIHMW